VSLQWLKLLTQGRAFDAAIGKLLWPLVARISVFTYAKLALNCNVSTPRVNSVGGLETRDGSAMSTCASDATARVVNTDRCVNLTKSG